MPRMYRNSLERVSQSVFTTVFVRSLVFHLNVFFASRPARHRFCCYPRSPLPNKQPPPWRNRTRVEGRCDPDGTWEPIRLDSEFKEDARQCSRLPEQCRDRIHQSRAIGEEILMGMRRYPQGSLSIPPSCIPADGRVRYVPHHGHVSSFYSFFLLHRSKLSINPAHAYSTALELLACRRLIKD